ncbi:MAG: RluA family pseudouridine synthase [Solobacterium sp.]|nr:RluA family pseudouridine synthase [Solobacterium sp.]
MLERKNWTAEGISEPENALEYIGRVLSLSERDWKVLLEYHLAGVNNHMITKQMTVHNGDRISVTIPDEKPPEHLPEEVPLEILYEDDVLLVLNKQRGTPVIPGPGNWHKTMTNGLLYYLGENQYGTFVHRLDATSSGCLLAAKTKRAAARLSEEIAEHKARRIYRALCEGIAEDHGVIDAPIGRDPEDFRRMAVTERESRHARTEYECMKKFGSFSEVRFRLETGRTHQIRVHAAYIGHPLIGDTLYGRECPYLKEQGAVLHAERICFTHPNGGYMEVEAPLPKYYTDLCEILEREKPEDHL